MTKEQLRIRILTGDKHVNSYDTAKIIAKDYFVSTVREQYLVNGKNVQHLSIITIRKPAKALSNSWDRLVFDTIYKVGFKWERVIDYLGVCLGTDIIPEELERAITRHTI